MTSALRMIPTESLEKAAACLKVMAHPVRLRIVEILMQRSLPVHEIARLCETPPHQTCEHLRLMQGHGFLTSERKGRSVHYAIDSPRLPALLRCVRKTCET